MTKGPEYAVTRSFPNSVQADVDFRHCLNPYCFEDQVVITCISLINQGPWLTSAPTEIVGGVSFALLNKGIKIWCATDSSKRTRFCEVCCDSLEIYKNCSAVHVNVRRVNHKKLLNVPAAIGLLSPIFLLTPF